MNGLTQKCNQAIHLQSRPKSLLDWSFEPWTKTIPPVKLWSSNPSDPHIFEIISEHLKSMSPIESGLWSGLAVVILVSLLSIPAFCFCFCPGALKMCMPACCSNWLFKHIDDKIFNNRELCMALAIMQAQNTPSAPVAEAESLPLNPMVSHPVDQKD